MYLLQRNNQYRLEISDQLPTSVLICSVIAVTKLNTYFRLGMVMQI